MQNNNGAQLNLPADPFKITQPQLQMSINNPPFVPNYNCHQNIQQYLPTIAAACAMEIQNNATRNNLRVFMFNHFSRNQYNNAEFAGLVTMVVDWLTLKMMRNEYPSIDVAAGDWIPKLVEQTAAAQVSIWPDMARVVDPSTHNVINIMVNSYNSVMNDIRNAQQSQNNNGNNWSGNNNSNNNWNNNNGNTNNNNNWNGNGSGGNSSANRQWNGQTVRATNSGSGNNHNPMFTNQTNAQASTVAGGTVNDRFARQYSGKFAADASAAPQTLEVNFPSAFAASPVVEQETIIETNTPSIEPVIGSKLKWRPSASQPYPMAYNPRKFIAYYQQTPSGDTVVVITERSSEMDYNLHTIPSTQFGPVPKNYNALQAVDAFKRIQKGVKEIVFEKDAINNYIPESDSVAPVAKLVREDWIASTSESSAWVTGALERMRLAKGEQLPGVYRIKAMISTPLISTTDETDTLRRFGDSFTYVELREKMRAVHGNVSPALWRLCEKKMTEHINHVLVHNLSIPELLIESFCDDIEDLYAVIVKKFGQGVKDAFLKYERMNIERMFVLPDDEQKATVKEMLMPVEPYPDNMQPEITLVMTHCTMTYLDCNSHDLEVEMDARVASGILVESHPLLHSIVSDLFEEVTLKDLFSHHFIRTNDNRVLEVTRGYIGSDFYLIKLID